MWELPSSTKKSKWSCSHRQITPTQYRFYPKNTRSTPPTKLEHQNPRTHNVSTQEFNQKEKKTSIEQIRKPKNEYKKWTSGIVMAATPSCGGLRFRASAHRWAWSLAWRSWSAPWLWRIGYGVERERGRERASKQAREKNPCSYKLIWCELRWVLFASFFPWVILAMEREGKRWGFS